MRSLWDLTCQVFSGLRFRLLVLLVLVCAPLVVLMLHNAGEDRRRAMNSWTQRSRRVLQLAQRQEDEVLAATRQLLFAISQSASVQELDPRHCQISLETMLKSGELYSSLGVVTTNGRVLACTSGAVNGADYSSRRFFIQALKTQDFSVGDLSLDTTFRRATVECGYPVLDSASRPIAVVFTTINLNRLRVGPELQAQLPRAAVWTAIDHNGTILARYPRPEEWVGRRLPDPALVSKAFSAPQGLTESVDWDGVKRFYAFGFQPSRLASGEVAALLGIPRQNLFAEADRVLRRNSIGLGLAATVAMLLGFAGSKFLIIRPVQSLVRSTAKLSMGDLSVRTGLPHRRDELGQLTEAFDQMASALEQRERERLRASQKLQILSHRLVEVQESERRHLARELHDEIGQSLTAAELNLQAALRSPAKEARERRLEESIAAVERVLEQVHDLSLNLRPSMLDDLGLEPALRWYTHRQANLTGMKAEFRAVPLTERLDPVIETECFRVAQEALTNVVRHARARSVSVALSRRNGHLHLSVRDDGIGFDVDVLRGKAVRGASLGLLSMEERTSLAGGGFELKSNPGGGTEVHAWFPLQVQTLPLLSISDE